MSELKKCLCGSVAICAECSLSDGEVVGCNVKCSSCGLSTDFYYDQNNAIIAWNQLVAAECEAQKEGE